MLGRIMILTGLILAFFSCEKNALFISGEDTIDTIKLESFERVEIKDVFEIGLVSDTVDYITVNCGENLLPNIEILQEENSVYLYNHNKYHWTRDYKKVNLEIHTTTLKTIIIREPVTLSTIDTFKMESISIVDWSKISIVDLTVNVNYVSLGVSASNTGEYTFRGKTNTSSFRLWGSCFYYADQLEANSCNINHDGIGDVYVNVKNKLTVKLNTYGNVFYKGNPIVDVEKNSTGSLIKLE